MQAEPIIECVPNFSEGRNLATINAIKKAIQKVERVKLLHIDRGEAANRTVFTFAGSPAHVVEAAFQAIKTAGELIDMRIQKGKHPRIGSTDVCPLVSIANISIEKVKEYAESLGKRVAEELGIPIYLYEYSATSVQRKNLATIRSGEYEGLAQKMQLAEWKPDFCESFNAKTGATVIGARNFLIAYNVNLDTQSAIIAHEIAREIRESGKIILDKNGKKVRVPGKCKSLKAIGWYIEDYQQAQVSMNLTDFSITGVHTAYETCKEIAKSFNVSLTGSELIGLIPKAAIIKAGTFYLKKERVYNPQNEKWIIETAIKNLGLDDLSPFVYQERIIEYLLGRGD